MKNTLPEQRKIFSVHRSLLGKFSNVRAGNERLFACASQNQHPNRRIVARIQQRALQFLDGPTVQSVEHLRPVEGNLRDAVILLVKNVFVAHHVLPIEQLSTLFTVSSQSAV